MGKTFRQFKRKAVCGAILRAVLGGLSLGALVMAACWLTAKWTLSEIHLLRFALIGAVPGVLLAAILGIILYPTDRRLAKKLDRDLSLGERAQTMVAFRGDSSPMAALQRADTEEHLQNAPRRRVKGTATWVFVAAPVVAVLCMAGTVIAPAKEPDAPPPVVDNSWYLDAFRQAKLEQLIVEVAASDMEEEVRDETVRLLENLLNRLKTVRKESVMQDEVVKTILAIHDTVSEHNIYDVITDAMENVPSDPIRRLGAALFTLKPLLINEQLKSIRDALAPAGREAEASHMALAIRQALALSGTPEDYRLRVALAALADRLDAITEETAESDLDGFYTEAETLLVEALLPETVNETVAYNTVITLKSIFGIPESALPEGLLDKPYDPAEEGEYDPEDSDDEHNDSGGLGSGEVLFGSNDTIYDPDAGAYVTYGEVLRRYHATVLELIGGGNLPPELEDMLHDYFAKLSDGGEQKD